MLVLIGLFIGFYMTGRVIDETSLNVQIISTDLSLNDTNQNLSCIISGGESLGENVKYKYKWKKNDVSEIIKAGEVIYSKPSNTRNWGGRESAVDSFGNIYTMSYSTYDTLDGQDDVTILKHDKNLNLLWEKRLIMPDSQAPDGVIVDENDDFYIGLRDGSSQSNYTIIKSDSSGNQIYNFTFSNFTPDWRGLRMDEEGNFYLLGFVSVQGIYGTHTDFRLVKLNSSGNLSWDVQYNYNEDSHESAYDIVFDSNGDIYALSREYVQEGGDYYYKEKFTILKIDSGGNILWNKTPNFELYGADKLEIDSQNNLYVLGDTQEYTSPVLLKFDSNGDLLWNMTLVDIPLEGEIQQDDYYSDNLYVDRKDSVITLFSHYSEDGAKTVVNKYDIDGELIENFSFLVDQQASPGIQYYDGQMVMSGYTRVSGLYSYFLASYFEYFTNKGDDWSNSYKIISDKTNSGDVWTCEGSAYSGEVETNVFSSDILIRDDYVFFDLVSDEKTLTNGSVVPISFEVTCNLGDCYSLNISLLEYNKSLTGFINKELPMKLYNDVSYVTYPACVELGRCDCLSKAYCLAFYLGEGPFSFNPIYETVESSFASFMELVEEYSPVNSEWAHGSCSEVQEFYPYGTYLMMMMMGSIQSDETSIIIAAPGEPEQYPSCLHMLDTDEYVDIVFFNLTLMDENLGIEGGAYYHYYRDLVDFEKYSIIDNNSSSLVFSNLSYVVLDLANGDSAIVTFYVGVNSKDLNEDVNFIMNANFMEENKNINSEDFYFEIVEFEEVEDEEIEEPRAEFSGGVGYVVTSQPEVEEEEVGEEFVDISSDEILIELYGDIPEEEIKLLDVENAERFGFVDGVELVSNYIKINYIDKNKYVNERLLINYFVRDMTDFLKYSGSVSFVVDDNFDNNVNLPVPNSLEEGEYYIETEVNTPDKFRITGKHSLVVEDENIKFPWIPIFIMGILVIGIVVVLDKISKNKKY